MIIKVDFYPPITYKDMENIFDVPKSVFVEMHFSRQLETKTIGKITYVSINSIKDLISSIPDDIKSIQRMCIKRKILTFKEDRILRYANLIRTMRNSNETFKKNSGNSLKAKRISDKRYNEINLALLEINNNSYFEDLLIDNITYSQIKKIILEVRNMKTLKRTATVAENLKKFKLELL